MCRVFSIFDEQKIERFIKTFLNSLPKSSMMDFSNDHHWIRSYIFHVMTEFMQNATEKQLNFALNRIESESRVDKLWWIRKKERKWYKINWNQKPVLPQRKKRRDRERGREKERRMKTTTSDCALLSTSMFVLPFGLAHTKFLLLWTRSFVLRNSPELYSATKSGLTIHN